MQYPQIPCDELKPCPFCGSKAVLNERHYNNADAIYQYDVVCPKCGAKTLPGHTNTRTCGESDELVYGRGKKEAISNWNQRASGKATKLRKIPVLEQ